MKSSSPSTNRSPRSRRVRASCSTTAIGCWAAGSSKVLRVSQEAELFSRFLRHRWRRRTSAGPALHPIERHVEDRIALPVLVVEVPPLRRVHDEPLVFQRPPEHGAVIALKRGAARIVGTRPIGGLV